eukprot:CAMPEP_0197576740 /NCGR_PEP_ID=MMETSP1326-20131121/1644_1 /TAXON_ID=1155430 /ORGANISM="Genus nov. species nov., Strain RCC2288" /LENGTH=298 /DNA_ID=CAMNT_0043139705 /DNA_START=48 /DNA_END=944 /DNA_ORIENTATION=+
MAAPSGGGGGGLASASASSFGSKLLDSFKIDISHQEMERIIVELEMIYKTQPGKWLPIYGIRNMLADDLGYEDEDEFEDALKGSFKDFIGALPHIEVDSQESELQPGLIRDVFRVIPDPPKEDCQPQRLVLRIEGRADLWRVLMLHPGAWCEIPELEFEIGADHRRRVDSVYNHIAASIFNLERHVEMLGADDAGAASERQGIKDACEELRKVLDCDTPCSFVVHDPEGLSAFKPSEGVSVSAMEVGGDYDRPGRALAVPADDDHHEYDHNHDHTQAGHLALPPPRFRPLVLELSDVV